MAKRFPVSTGGLRCSLHRSTGPARHGHKFQGQWGSASTHAEGIGTPHPHPQLKNWTKQMKQQLSHGTTGHRQCRTEKLVRPLRVEGSRDSWDRQGCGKGLGRRSRLIHPCTEGRSPRQGQESLERSRSEQSQRVQGRGQLRVPPSVVEECGDKQDMGQSHQKAPPLQLGKMQGCPGAAQQGSEVRADKVRWFPRNSRAPKTQPRNRTKHQGTK